MLPPVNFALTNTAGLPASFAVLAGTPQQATINTAYATRLQVAVADIFGNPVSGAPVSFAVPGSGATGVFSGSTTVATNAAGIATAPVLTANAITGPFTATASFSRFTPLSFALTNVSTPVITSVDNTTFTIGVPNSFTILASGSPIPSITAASLPTGVSFVDNGGGTATLTYSAAFKPNVGTYPIQLTAANGVNPNFVQTFKLSFSASPPVITTFSTNDNPAFPGLPVTYLLSASATFAPTLSYKLDFGDATAPLTGTFAQGTSVSLIHMYASTGTYTINVSVSDSLNTTSMAVQQVVPAPNSMGAGVPNVSNKTDTIVNPVNDLTISVTNSSGAVIQLGIDVNSLIRSNYDVTTDFGDISGRTAKVPGTSPVHQYVQHGIFVAKVTVVDPRTKQVAGFGRKTLTISNKETGETPPNATGTREAKPLADAPSSAIAVNSLMGKFIFSGSSNDTVSFSGTIQLPAGLDITKQHEFMIGIGNIIVDATVGKNGKGTAVAKSSALRSLKIQYPKLKHGAVTTGGESAVVSAIFSTAGMVAAGFDTEGVTRSASDAAFGKKAPRNIQISMLLDGVPYETLAPVSFAIDTHNSDFGVISGRTKK